MNTMKAKMEQRNRRIKRVRSKIVGTSERPRLAVFRSLNHIDVQLIDDASGKTLVAATDRNLQADKATKTERAFQIGKLIAEKAKAKNISSVVFDRRDKRYHGRVKAVAEGAREGGLVF
jgi:large subunit ribosomal protein L18